MSLGRSLDTRATAVAGDGPSVPAYAAPLWREFLARPLDPLVRPAFFLVAARPPRRGFLAASRLARRASARPTTLAASGAWSDGCTTWSCVLASMRSLTRSVLLELMEGGLVCLGRRVELHRH